MSSICLSVLEVVANYSSTRSGNLSTIFGHTKQPYYTSPHHGGDHLYHEPYKCCLPMQQAQYKVNETQNLLTDTWHGDTETHSRSIGQLSNSKQLVNSWRKPLPSTLLLYTSIIPDSQAHHSHHLLQTIISYLAAIKAIGILHLFVVHNCCRAKRQGK